MYATFRISVRLLAITTALALAVGCSKPAPLSIDELREREFFASLFVERQLASGEAYDAYLVSYMSSGLKVHAMVAEPKQGAPADGYPILIANHGYVPEPQNYGIGADGVDARPGDYYRDVPEIYAAEGFLVVMPDYRGHGDSEGMEYTRGREAAVWYVEDVLALVAALGDLDNANTDEVYMWGHSMGASVTLRALLASDRVKAATLWSTIEVDELLQDLDYLTTPIIVQHSVRDRTAAAANSGRLVNALRARNLAHQYHTYTVDQHFFADETRQKAVERDIAFLRQQ